MKFKAEFSERGRQLLVKKFLPCLEKHGKTCHLLLSPEEMHIIQTVADADGMNIVARWAMDVLFEPDSWKVQSKHGNLIALKLEVAHLRGSLKAAGNSDADKVEIRLKVKTDQRAEDIMQSVTKVYLCLTSKGQNTDMTHEMPIGRPFTPKEIDDLLQHKDSTLCPYYLDIQGEQSRLQALVDKLKSLNSSMSLVTTKRGFLYLGVSTPGMQLTSEVQNLEIAPTDARSSADPYMHSSPEGRLQEALRTEDGHQVMVQVKQLSRSLHSSQVPTPVKLLLGIAANLSHVHFMFVFEDVMSEAGYDESMQLTYVLPVRGED